MLEQLLRKLCVQTAGGAGGRVLCPQGTALSSSSVLNCDLSSSSFFFVPPSFLRSALESLQVIKRMGLVSSRYLLYQ